MIESIIVVVFLILAFFILRSKGWFRLGSIPLLSSVSTLGTPEWHLAQAAAGIRERQRLAAEKADAAAMEEWLRIRMANPPIPTSAGTPPAAPHV